jgi:hypothetical protein
MFFPMATRVKRIRDYEGGSEAALSGLGTFFLVVGVIGALLAFAFAGLNDRNSSLWITAGVVGLVQGMMTNILCKGFAEIIRLLKKLNGIPFGGHISKATPLYENVCSECGTSLYDEFLPAAKCPKCAVEFEAPSTSISATLEDRKQPESRQTAKVPAAGASGKRWIVAFGVILFVSLVGGIVWFAISPHAPAPAKNVSAGNPNPPAEPSKAPAAHEFNASGFCTRCGWEKNYVTQNRRPCVN